MTKHDATQDFFPIPESGVADGSQPLSETEPTTPLLTPGAIPADYENPFPAEFGYYRIGTPINADTNQAHHRRPAFQMSKLAKANLLLIDSNSVEEREIHGCGYDQKSQDAWGYSTAMDLGLKTGYVNASVSFHLTQTRNICRNAARQNISASAYQKSGILLLEAEEEQLLACATPGFRNRILALRKARTAEQAIDALAKFYADYGTGFISKLHLTAFALFKGTADYESLADTELFAIGAGVSISAPVGGPQVGVDFSKQNMNANASGQFEAHAFALPTNTRLAEWANGFMGEFAGQQLSKLSEMTAWNDTFHHSVPEPKEPEIPEEPVNDEPLPNYHIENFKEAAEQMQFARFREDFMRRNPGTEPSKKDYENAINALKKRSRMGDDRINQPRKLSSRAKSIFSNPATVPPSVIADDVSFGEYAITGYDYTPWEQVLPRLKSLGETLTSAQINMGHAMVWLSIRGLFSQYLKYCAHYPEIAPVDIKSLSGIYDRAFEYMSNHIGDSLNKRNILGRLEASFRKMLEDGGFPVAYYLHLVEHYPWLKRVPFGAVALVDYGDKFYFQRHGKGESIPLDKSTIFPASQLVGEGAYRLHPILSIAKDGSPYFVWAGAHTWTDDVGGIRITTPSPHFYSSTPLTWVSFKNGLLKMGMHADLAPRRWVKAVADFVSDSVRILPETDSINEKIWTLRNTLDEGKRPDGQIFLEDGVFNGLILLTGHRRPLNIKEPGLSIEHHEMRLVPIDYDAVALAGGNVPYGGTPMWFEPRTDKILTKLRELAK